MQGSLWFKKKIKVVQILFDKEKKALEIVASEFG